MRSHPLTRVIHAGFSISIRQICRFLILLFLITQAQAETGATISGVVSDTSGVPLYGAHVTILEMQSGAVSDNNGRYRIEGLVPGSYTLSASYIGFDGFTQQDVLVIPGSPVLVDFTLRPSPVTMPVVTVNSVSSPHILQQENRIVISDSWWEERGAISVGEALRDVPGVTVLEGGGMQRVSLRGSPSRAVRIEIDDIPLNDAGTGEADLSGINLEHVKSIEVEYAGLGGRINLSTSGDNYSGHGVGGSELKAGLNSGGGSNEGVGLHYGNDEIQAILLADHEFEPGDFDYTLENGEQHSRINNWVESLDGILKLGRQGGNNLIESGIYFEDKDRGIPGLIYQPLTPEASLTTRRVSARLASQFLINDFITSFIGYISRYQSTYLNPAAQFDPSLEQYVYHLPEHNRQTGYRSGFKSEIRRYLRHLSFSGVYDFQFDRYEGEDLRNGNETIGGVGIGGARRWSHSLNANAAFNRDFPDCGFMLSPSVNMNMVTDEGNETYRRISPGIYSAVEKSLYRCKMVLDAGWGRTLSTPPFNALFLVENTFAVGNPDLKPEKGESLNYGVSVASDASRLIKWNLRLDRFQRETQDLIVWRKNFQGKYYPANVDRVKTRGMEINGYLGLKSGSIGLNGSYIYNRSVNDTEGDINQGRLIPLIPKDSGSAGITLRKWQTSFNLSGRWVGRRYSTEANLDHLSSSGRGLPPYSVYDITVIRKFKYSTLNLDFEISLKNIFDRSYLIIERSPMPGRSLSLKLTMRI